MRKLLYALLFLVAAVSTFAQNIPERPMPPKLVNDYANMLAPQEQMQLEQKLRTYNDSTSTQIAVVTVPTLDGYEISEYAFALGRKWGIGQKGKNNGVLILIKPKTADERGQAFIATGYGMEGALTDAQSSRIVNQILIPAFKENQNFAGIDKAVDRIIQISSGEYTQDPKKPETVSPITSIVIFFMLVVLFALISIVAKKQQKKYGDGVSYSSQGFKKNPAANSLPWWLLMMGMGSMSNRHRNSHWDDFSGGGGFGGGFGGGGFGGFGGGSFGGGGAGGSW